MKHLTALLTLVFLLAGTAHAAPPWEAQGFAHRPVADTSNQSGMSLDQAVKRCSVKPAAAYSLLKHRAKRDSVSIASRS